MNATSDWNEFTETAFRRLVVQLRQHGYRFARYGEAEADRHVLWRHDVDLSMHRAARLAEIEAEEGAIATYFVNPRCMLYNLAEADVLACARRIIALGHQIGLHFDVEPDGAKAWTLSRLKEALARERRLVETILNHRVSAVSWHNPDQSNLLEVETDAIGGLVNAYGARLRRDYVYCSDSNGYWHHTPMPEVISSGHTRLHLLTHPGWWTPEPMSPSARVNRCIQGRALAVRKTYDHLLSRAGRLNLGETAESPEGA